MKLTQPAAPALLALPAAAQNQLWIRQLAMSDPDQARAAEPDGAGGVYVRDLRNGSLGELNARSAYAWLAPCDGVGNKSWIRGTVEFTR